MPDPIPPGFRLISGNRLEMLAEALAGILQTPLPSALQPEWIVVQSKGMERWICLQLALHQGVCANAFFPFPNRFADEIFSRIRPDAPDSARFDPPVLLWRIMQLLPRSSREAGFETVRRYLAGEPSDLRRYQLARRLADLFDQYLLYRPDMVLGWEGGQDDHWQARLWRELTAGQGARHRAAFAKGVLKTLNSLAAPPQDLPSRVAVFGIAALPRFHLELLSALSRFCQVNLFQLNPCREYWGGILSESEIVRAVSRRSAGSGKAQDLHLERGNSLLASLGRLGRDFLDLIQDFPHAEATLFEVPGHETLLRSAQSDILELRDRGRPGAQKQTLDPGDDSLRVHSCHSRMREMEVLQNELLRMFETSADLLPRDILVMAPEIEAYEPAIRAVFDLPPEDPRRLPFAIADRTLLSESNLIATFLSILDLWGSRYNVNRVLSILELPAVRQRFGLAEADLDLVRRWVAGAGIRWGLDGSHRSQLGLPAVSENTWEAGIEGLLLGYAMSGREEQLFGDILPRDGVEGGQAEALGRFAGFIDTLFRVVGGLGEPRTPGAWAETLGALLEALFQGDGETERDLQALQGLIVQLAERQAAAGYGEPTHLRVVRRHLDHALRQAGFGFGFMTGGITFCAMLPMRSIPFRVICLVGMDQQSYPRRSHAASFDLMARDPRPGDRSRRSDDRYLFLEALLSAREKLWITYVGQNIRDNSPAPASVLVSELLDYVEQGFQVPGREILDQVKVRHRMQAFSPAYFQGQDGLRSYSEADFRAACRLAAQRERPPSFFSIALPEPEPEWRSVSVNDLLSFFTNPARFILNRRLKVYLDEEPAAPQEQEIFEMAGLERYLLEQRLLERELAGGKPWDLFPAVRAAGRIPHGQVGRCYYEKTVREMEAFVERLRPYLEPAPAKTLPVDLRLGEFTLTGRIAPVHPRGLLRYRYARVKARDRLQVWICHLVLNCLPCGGQPLGSHLAGLDPHPRRGAVWAQWSYSPVKEAAEILGDLLELYWQGLRAPLVFFPESSWAFFEELRRSGGAVGAALQQAAAKWSGSDYARGEGQEPHWERCFGGREALDEDFREIASRVYEALAGHETRVAE